MADLERYKSMWYELSELSQREEYAGLWSLIVRDVELRTEAAKAAQELEDLKEMAADYGGCCQLQAKVENEGLGYFYNSYTTVPASFETYVRYCGGAMTGECWCEHCSNATCACVHPDACQCEECVYWRYDPEKDYNSVKIVKWMVEWYYGTCAEQKECVLGPEMEGSIRERCAAELKEAEYEGRMDVEALERFILDPACWCGKCETE